MTTQGIPATDDSAETPDVGDFPFPLSSGTRESRYLVWLRNHSNYMAVRGFLDYFRSAGALLRGIVINFLIFVPFLLVASVVLAFAHHWMLRNPFQVTLWALAIAAACILLFPIAVQLYRLSKYRQSLQTGSDSSVKKRDVYERLFGALLLLILTVAFFESLPWIVEFFQERVRKGTFGWQGGLATLGTALTVLSASAKLLSAVRGAARKLAIGLIGILGLLVPLSVILLASGYLLYAFPPSPFAIIVPVIAAVFIVIGIIAAIVIGVSGRNLKRKEIAFAIVLLIVGLSLGIQGVPTAATMASNAGVNASKTLQTLVQPVTRLANALDQIKTPENLDRELVHVLEETKTRYSEWRMARAELPDVHGKGVSVDPPGFWQAIKKSVSSKESKAFSSYYNREILSDYWRTNQSLWERNNQMFYSRERQLFPLVDTLLSQPEGALASLRPAIVRLARNQLTDRIGDGPNESNAWADTLLRSGLNTGEDAVKTLNARNKLRELVEREFFELSASQLKEVAKSQSALADDLAVKLMFGQYGGLEANSAGTLREQLTQATYASKTIFVLLLAIVIWLGCWITVDVNLTSIHALYRDRLASAFLIGKNTKDDIDIEEDIDLHAICRYEAGSTAPYHLINVALNMQGSNDIGIRDRNSDFFMFSKRFVGGDRTGYCRSELMEQVFPQMSLGTAMAISAAAASPNMGRGTSPLLVAFMTLLNIRLGFWVPNPGLLEESARNRGRRRRHFPQGDPPGIGFAEVFARESRDIETRWGLVYEDPLPFVSRIPTVEHGLVGIAFSGGGIRSAAINLGITQALHKRGVFDHVDYMSTVSGGGYLGSSISTLMRSRKGAADKPLHTQRGANDQNKIAKTVAVESTTVAPSENEYEDFRLDSIGDRFRWQVRPVALLREIFSRLDERHRWVNLSDGGHIENLATIELLHRRCKYIIIGDGEADPNLHFAGLATLMRAAHLDLQIKIEIDLEAIRLKETGKGDSDAGVSESHWTIGRITYPKLKPSGKTETGYLLYLKSSFTGDEDETIREYRHRNPTFPHQTTADQFFDEGQFEAYRALGQHIAELALDGEHRVEPVGNHSDERAEDSVTEMSYEELERWFEDLWEKRKPAQPV